MVRNKAKVLALEIDRLMADGLISDRELHEINGVLSRLLKRIYRYRSRNL